MTSVCPQPWHCLLSRLSSAAQASFSTTPLPHYPTIHRADHYPSTQPHRRAQPSTHQHRHLHRSIYYRITSRLLDRLRAIPRCLSYHRSHRHRPPYSGNPKRHYHHAWRLLLTHQRPHRIRYRRCDYLHHHYRPGSPSWLVDSPHSPTTPEFTTVCLVFG